MTAIPERTRLETRRRAAAGCALSTRALERDLFKKENRYDERVFGLQFKTDRFMSWTPLSRSAPRTGWESIGAIPFAVAVPVQGEPAPIAPRG